MTLLEMIVHLIEIVGIGICIFLVGLLVYFCYWALLALIWRIDFFSLRGLTPEEEKEYWQYRGNIARAKTAVSDEKYRLFVLKDNLRRQRSKRQANMRKDRKQKKKELRESLRR